MGIGNVTIEDAELLFLNFAGRPEKFNPDGGKRSFCVILPDDLAADMQADGWNVKFLKPRDEGDEPTPYVQVAVAFGNRPPRITLITSTARTGVGEDTVETLDYVEMDTVDLVLNPYEWEMNGKTGVKAYLQSMYVTLVEDELDLKYAVTDEPGYDDE